MLTRILAVTAEVSEGRTEHELPLPPLGFGLIALGAFVVLLAATFAFRGVANRH
ncbi:MAG: hypothetical protein U0Q15_11785 [Kineosporiaceae bacterium]